MNSMRSLTCAAGLLLTWAASGCGPKWHCRPDVPPPTPLGTLSDPIWQQQEVNAEASDFVVHEHEFRGNSARLNAAGEQHVLQIAARLRDCDAPFPVLIEPSSLSVRPEDRYGYPVHNDPALDLRRRALIVHSLTELGVPDAEQRVVVSPALTPGFQQFEAERAYHRGFGWFGGARGLGFGGGWGGGFGGFGGFGGAGGMF
jgi:hypothetical protein